MASNSSETNSPFGGMRQNFLEERERPNQPNTFDFEIPCPCPHCISSLIIRILREANAPYLVVSLIEVLLNIILNYNQNQEEPQCPPYTPNENETANATATATEFMNEPPPTYHSRIERCQSCPN